LVVEEQSPLKFAQVISLLNMRGAVGHLAGRRYAQTMSMNETNINRLSFFYLMQEKITRSKEEAIKILRGYEAEIGGSADKFAELASKYSDCSSHSNKGDLGWFGPRQMQKPFEEATYALQVGQISDVVDTDSGVHLILRTG
jgi:hypothetical protein